MRCSGADHCAGMVRTMSICKLFTGNHSLRSQLLDYMNITTPAHIPHEHAHKNDKPDYLGDEHIGGFRNITMTDNIQQVIHETPIRIPLWELPSQGRPEERGRTHPHPVLHQMQKTCPCHLDATAAVPAPVKEYITANKEDEYEHQRMPDQPAAGNGLSEQEPAYGLIDEVRQQGSERDDAVIKAVTDGGYDLPKYEEDAECDTEMAEDEHYKHHRTCTFKTVHLQVQSCGDP